jgi:uncharacterized small protein (DUF1192 family)
LKGQGLLERRRALVSITLEELVRRIEKLENEVATLKKQLRERGKKRSKGAGEAILRLGEQIGERLKGSNIALSDFVLQNRADQF